MLPMTRFKLRISDIGSNLSAIWFTTTARPSGIFYNLKNVDDDFVGLGKFALVLMVSLTIITTTIVEA